MSCHRKKEAINIDEGAAMLAAMPLEVQREMIEWLLDTATALGISLDEALGDKILVDFVALNDPVVSLN